ncbi:hypothetical protein O9993_08135 [Vibrio lentus]|nr:hypothetical protein [Vibrio lentus]
MVEAGVGYQLKPTFILPPMMFSTEELKKTWLAEWVAAAPMGNSVSQLEMPLPRFRSITCRPSSQTQ